MIPNVNASEHITEHNGVHKATDDHAAAAADAVKSVVARLQQAQQTEDVTLFTSLFRQDAVWTTAMGKRLIGLPEIAEFTQSVLPGAMRDSSATYDVTHIVWARPDVAIVTVTQVAVDLDGLPLVGTPEGRPTYVMTQGDDGWKLIAGQNTQVAS